MLLPTRHCIGRGRSLRRRSLNGSDSNVRIVGNELFDGFETSGPKSDD